MTSKNSVLYLRLPNWIGDVCMALPCLQAALNSGMPTVVCARPWAEDLLQGYPITAFIPMSGSVRTDRKRVTAYRRTQPAHRALGLLLPDSLSSALVFRLSGIYCAGYRDDGRSVLLKWPFEKPQPKPHAVESWYALTRLALTAWQYPLPAAQPARVLNLTLTAAHEQATSLLMRDAGLEAGKFVLIAPTATGRHKGQIKVWPGFNELTRALQARGIKVVMCPPPGEREEALKNAPDAQCLESLTLGAFAKLTRMSALVICNDSGVSHVAAAAGARQITLFGVTDAKHTGPWSPSAVCLGQPGEWPDTHTVIERALSLLGHHSLPGKNS